MIFVKAEPLQATGSPTLTPRCLPQSCLLCIYGYVYVLYSPYFTLVQIPYLSDNGQKEITHV